MQTRCNYICLQTFMRSEQIYVLDLSKIFDEISETKKRGNEIVNI